MAFILRTDKKETENKTIRFPIDLISRIENILENKNSNFSRFVIQACEYALDNINSNEIEEKKKETVSNVE